MIQSDSKCVHINHQFVLELRNGDILQPIIRCFVVYKFIRKINEPL